MPNKHLIYPDTNIWNYLAQLTIDETALFHSLASEDASLVLSSHAVYELARTFTGKGGDAVGIPCSKEVMELLKEECYAFENHLPAIDPLLNDTDRDIVKLEVEKLAGGVVEGTVRAFIDKRTEFAADTRADQRDHLAGRRH